MKNEIKGHFEKFKNYILENVIYLTDRLDNDNEYRKEFREGLKTLLSDEKVSPQ